MTSTSQSDYRLWYNPSTGRYTTCTQDIVQFRPHPFWKRIIMAFWYVVRPCSEDAENMVDARRVDAAPPVSLGLLHVKLPSPNILDT
jgi:hypothetical protein